MKNALFSILCCLLFGFVKAGTGTVATVKQALTADSILSIALKKLSALKSIRYDHKRELHYPSLSMVNSLTGNAYFDFTSKDDFLGAKYYFAGSGTLLGFNGSESFICSDDDDSMLVNRKPDAAYMETLSFLNHSVFSIRSSLAWIIADKYPGKSVLDTVFNGEPCYDVRFLLERGVIGTIGKRGNLTENRNIIYQFFIRKRDYLPAGIHQSNNINDDYLITTFSNIITDVPPLEESLLYYSTYLKKYKERTGSGLVPLIKTGQRSFEWQLKEFGTNAEVSLSSIKGKVVLLDFWIYHCSSCITQVPVLNAISKKFSGADFRLYGVNAYDNPVLIRSFIEKRGPVEYPVLMEGEPVRLSYGIEGFPFVVLLDKRGIVLYAGEMNQQLIEKLIAQNL